jgi:septum formation protein
MFQNKKIILASASPRRSQLLGEAGFSFVVKATHVDEDFPETMPVDEVAPFLAEKKAEAARDFIENDEIVLAADSVVILGNTIFGKPTDRADAQYILSQLSGNMHRVITGVCLLSKGRKKVFAAEARVYFDTLSPAEIDFYIDQYQPYDKAGAYAIQEWIGLCKIQKIEGTFSNIMGLPMNEVYRELEGF